MAKKKLLNFEARPLSWSAISSFEWDPDQWYRRYVLKEPDEPSAEMLFGKDFARSCEMRKPMAPVTLLPVLEHKMSVVFNGVPLIGFADTWCPDTKTLGEYKTSGKPWDQKKVDAHGQLTMYALMLYVGQRIRPEELTIFLENVLTEQRGDFTVGLREPKKVFRFATRRTMGDVLAFGARINDTVAMMEAYAQERAVRDKALPAKA